MRPQRCERFVYRAALNTNWRPFEGLDLTGEAQYTRIDDILTDVDEWRFLSRVRHRF